MTLSLVAGGAGFIGSHLCEYLLAQKESVICVDNLLTGSKSNIEHLTGNPAFTFVQYDIVNPLTIIPFFFEKKIDTIYNLACPASPKQYQKNKIVTLDTSTQGTRHLLDLAQTHGARFLQASTSEVYGDPLEHPQKETYHGNVNSLGVRACYDEGKRVAETYCMAYHWQNNVPVRIVRIFNTYGPRMAVDDGRVISSFIVQALRWEDIVVNGDGKQTRSFCYVDDMTEGLYRMVQQDTHIGPINLGNPHEHTILQLANIIKKEIKSKSRIVFGHLPPDDPVKRKPDISLAKNILKWKPQTSLREGLQKTIAYFEKVLRQ